MLTRTLELDSVVVPFWGNHKQIGTAKEKYGPDLDLNVRRPEGDAALSYLGSKTTMRDILGEFGIRTKREVYKNENLL